MKASSLKDIAIALNVSRTLVSMVLNGQGDQHGISLATQEKVRKKAKELNYRPNHIARGLRTGKSNTIGLIVSDISNSFYAQIAKRIEFNARVNGYNVIFCSSEENAEREEEMVKMLLGRQVDGLIIAPTAEKSDFFKNLKSNQIPIVFFDRSYADFEADYVMIDNFESSYRAVKHLIQLGHHSIALFTLSPEHISTIEEREKGYKAAILDAGLSEDDILAYKIDHSSIKRDIRSALDRIRDLASKPTAIYTVNNQLTIQILSLIKENYSELSDLSILCFDDLDVFSFCEPTITAVRQPLNGIADSSFSLLMDKLNQKNKQQSPVTKILNADLIIRSSCKPRR